MPRETQLPSALDEFNVDSVFDFGGGGGWTYLILAPACRRALSNYVVLELPGVVHEFTPLSEVHSNLHFMDSSAFDALPGSQESTLLFSNSALQYCESPLGLISGLLDDIDPDILVLDDVQVSPDEGFASLQRYYGDLIPSWFLDPEGLVREVEQLGWELHWRRVFPVKVADNMRRALELEPGKILEVPASLSLCFLKAS